MNRRVLLVDDEPAVLDSLHRQLCFDFDLYIAESGAEALKLMETSQKFAVVLTDMRMPEMDGITFLTKVRAISEDTVRMMLTGNSDQKTAVDALNDGYIFRFMNKPCSNDVIRNSLQAGLEQFKLITAEKDLLSLTLLDSARMLTELMAVTNPLAFGRSSRIGRWSKNCAVQLQLEKPWEVELAAIFSQIGSLVVSPKTPAADVENPLVLDVSQRLVSQIPRLETVARIIVWDLESDSNCSENESEQEICLSAQVFRAALAFDRALMDENHSEISAIKTLRDKQEVYSQRVLDALESVILSESSAKREQVSIHSLPEDAILAEDIHSVDGMLLLSQGQQLVEPLRQRLMNYWQSGRLTGNLTILCQEDS